MEQLKKLKLFSDKWHKKMTKQEIKDSRQQLMAYTVAKELETGILEQLCVIAACYPTLQDLILEVRKKRKDGLEEVPIDTIADWEERLLKIDKVIRDRLFILTIAAEKGWRVATDVAFNMKGDLADKNLAKALKKDEKRKREAKEDRDKGKKKPGFRGMGRGNLNFGAFLPAMSWGNPFQFGFGPQQMPGMMAPQGPQVPPTPTAFIPRVETRTCLNCRQTGHLARNCPQRPFFPAPSAAAGAPPQSNC